MCLWNKIFHEYFFSYPLSDILVSFYPSEITTVDFHSNSCHVVLSEFLIHIQYLHISIAQISFHKYYDCSALVSVTATVSLLGQLNESLGNVWMIPHACLQQFRSKFHLRKMLCDFSFRMSVLCLHCIICSWTVYVYCYYSVYMNIMGL